jgi:hypothetical protein
MALDGTAAGLRASIAEWLDDTTLAASIPDFITMAEARFNRLLREIDMEARAFATTGGEWMTLPADFGGMRSVFVRGVPNDPLEQMESGEMRRLYGFASPGAPRAFAITAGQLQFAPVPVDPVEIEMVYSRKVPPLASNDGNWLLTDHPDVYLYACLLAGEMRGWNDGRLPLLKSAFDEGLQEIVINSEKKRYGAAPLSPRIAVRA